MIFQKLGINNDKKFYLILGGILFFFIILLQFQISYQEMKIIKNKQNEIVKTCKVNQQQHQITKQCVILHNHIIKTTSLDVSKLNVKIMRFMRNKKHNKQQYDMLLIDINRTLNEMSVLLDKYNASEHSKVLEGNIK